jgi:VWFA-related protein
LAIDTSGSMLGQKIAAAQSALHRFLFDLLGPEDEVFLYRFAGKPELLQRWTTDRTEVMHALGTVHPNGATAIYDTVAEAVPLAQSGTRRKKALVLISDGCDTNSHTNLDTVRQIVRDSDVLVYAVGIDASGADIPEASSRSAVSAGAKPVPSAFPGAPQPAPAAPPTVSPAAATRAAHSSSSDRINVDALRAITDDSGGRTEVVVSSRDLDPSTARIADELSRQYFLGYVSAAPRDGRWHTIEVVVRGNHYTVRARRGFIAH